MMVVAALGHGEIHFHLHFEFHLQLTLYFTLNCIFISVQLKSKIGVHMNVVPRSTINTNVRTEN